MSADDGWLVRRGYDEGYVVHYYKKSEEKPAVDDGCGAWFQNLETAIVWANKKDLNTPSRHGVRVILFEVKKPQFLCEICFFRVVCNWPGFVKVRRLSKIEQSVTCLCGKQTSWLVEPMGE